MNCYDFDKTIYRKDCSVQFYLYCLFRNPFMFLHLFKVAFYMILNKLGIVKTKKFKEKFFSFLKHIDNVDECVDSFWNKEIKNVNQWYTNSKANTDVICTASPSFLVSAAMSKINPTAIVVATQFDLNSLTIIGENLKDEEKVNALKEVFNTEDIKFNAVYTDSISDLPILDLTENKYIVGRNKKPYQFGKQKVSIATKIRYIIKQMRVKHYVKNVLVFLPLFFSGLVTNLSAIKYSVSGFISFCLIASFVYVFNDLRDAKSDRNHSKKRTRPIACYMIRPYEAIVMMCILFAGSIAINILTFGVNIGFLALILLYAVINLLYTFVLKNIPIIDAFILALCYMIRVLFGGMIIGVSVSKWLYLTILCGALFMGFGKRRNEISQETNTTRKVNKFYNYKFLDKNLYLCLAMCLVFYSLWATDLICTGGSFNKLLLLATIPLIYFIMMRYSLDIEHTSNNGDPIDVLFKDYVLICSAVVFVGMLVIAVYVPINISLF